MKKNGAKQRAHCITTLLVGQHEVTDHVILCSSLSLHLLYVMDIK